MKDLSYTQIFPVKKRITHEESLISKIKSGIVTIIREENGISEKSFGDYQKVIDLVNSKFDKSMIEFSISEYASGKRIGLICELIYDQSFKSISIDESVVSKFGDFKNDI